MANNPKKVKDPTEVALSAIQEALNISDLPADDSARSSVRSDVTPTNSSSTSAYDESAFDTRPSDDRAIFEPIKEQRPTRRAANDDRETIGKLLQAIQKGRPARNVYTIATTFAAVWLIGVGLLTFNFLPSLQAAMGQGSGALVLAGLAALLLAPVMLFYFLASLSWRGQELRMIAQSMAQVAIRFSEPESAASDSMVTVGQAIRREVAAMGDGVERAIARAGELETLVANEVSALERAYTDNEVRIRALAAGYRPSARQSCRPGRAGSQRHLRRANRSAPRYRADLGRDRLPRRRGCKEHYRRAWKNAVPTSPAPSAVPATT